MNASLPYFFAPSHRALPPPAAPAAEAGDVPPAAKGDRQFTNAAVWKNGWPVALEKAARAARRKRHAL